MITLDKLEHVDAGKVPITTYRAKTDTAVMRWTAVTSDQAVEGWVATFSDDEWPKHVHYAGMSEVEAGHAAAADLVRLTSGHRLERARMDAYYWLVVEEAQ